MDGADEVKIQTDPRETSDEMPDQRVSKDSKINISSCTYIHIHIYIYNYIYIIYNCKVEYFITTHTYNISLHI